ncbi:MAG: hypothetical protein NW201_12540, partial [Gemmatimonadales bacterium]|nr:hypothetical protein [Gemmatimonadales bacterium]
MMIAPPRPVAPEAPPAPTDPLGVFDLPAALLRLPDTNDALADAARASLLRATLPTAMPDAWRFFVAAAEGRDEEALALLPAGDTPALRHDRFVLAPSPEAYAAAAAGMDGADRQLLDLAAWALGVRAEEPATDRLEGAAAALAALVSAARAGTVDVALAAQLGIDALEVRTASPVLASRLLAAQAAA